MEKTNSFASPFSIHRMDLEISLLLIYLGLVNTSTVAALFFKGLLHLYQESCLLLALSMPLWLDQV